jgi:hypothetical protein
VLQQVERLAAERRRRRRRRRRVVGVVVARLQHLGVREQRRAHAARFEEEDEDRSAPSERRCTRSACELASLDAMK